MKSAYELAMERLEESEPSVKISNDQRDEIASLDDKFKAKIAEKELFLSDLIQKAKVEGNYAELPELEEQKAREIRRLKEQCEEEKEKVRNG
jgi:hypothetical protein